MRHRSQREVVCAICGNTDDLSPLRGQLVCRSCRICPHLTYYSDNSTPCPECFRALYTTETFVGRHILDVEEYLEAAWHAGIPLDAIRLWTMEEVNYYFQWATAGKRALSAAWQEHMEDVVCRYPFPFPLVHLLPQDWATRPESAPR